MLCQYCEDFDYDRLVERPGYKHQPTWQALKSSAAQGCDVCSLVSSESRPADWDAEEQGYYKDESTKQVYCTLDSQTRGTMFWNYGKIQRAQTGVCVRCEYWLRLK